MTNMLDSGLKVYPTHRLLMNWPQGWDEARFEQALLQNFAQVESGEDFVYRTQSKTVKLKLTSHDAVAALPELLRPLDVAVLDQVVFQTIFGQTANALKDAKVLRFYRDEALVEHLISQKEAVAVFYMQAPNVEQVRDVCEAGFRMPQKSTYFYPKILSGLVLYSYGELSDGSHALDGSLQKRGQVLPADLFSLQRDLQPV
jgi:hypothetical protein